MPVIKYFDRLKRMDDLIRRRATGSPEQFATKMGMDRSTLMRYLSELRELDAPIYFDPIKQSYYYEEEVCLELGFKRISKNVMARKVGGSFLKEIYPVSKYATKPLQVCSMFNF
ncbi:hypothetical protein [Ekhidna sp.]|uniref:hypothetical protein n=1 Tax=Ekhidna sp. TaxID=2608089 RepID=UPI003B58C86B